MFVNHWLASPTLLKQKPFTGGVSSEEYQLPAGLTVWHSQPGVVMWNCHALFAQTGVNISSSHWHKDHDTWLWNLCGLQIAVKSKVQMSRCEMYTTESHERRTTLLRVETPSKMSDYLECNGKNEGLTIKSYLTQAIESMGYCYSTY